MDTDNTHHRSRRGIYLLPNMITTAGLFSGFYAIVAATNGRFEAAAIAIFIAMVMLYASTINVLTISTEENCCGLVDYRTRICADGSRTLFHPKGHDAAVKRVRKTFFHPLLFSLVASHKSGAWPQKSPATLGLASSKGAVGNTRLKPG